MCWSNYKADLIIISFKLTCSRGVAMLLLSWHYTTITHNNLKSLQTRVDKTIDMCDVSDSGIELK